MDDLRRVRRALELAAAGGLLAGYGGVALLARAPRVDEAYRAYYIDRTTTISPTQRARASAYAPGARIAHGEERIALFDGWSRPGPELRWSNGGRVALVLRVADPTAFAGRLELAGAYFGTQEVAVSINGTEIARYVASGDAVRAIGFDPALLRAGDNEIALAFSDPRSPGPHDTRELAFGLRHASLR